MPNKKKSLMESNEEDIRDLLLRIENKISDSEESLKRFVDGKLNRLSDSINELESIVFETKNISEIVHTKTKTFEDAIQSIDDRIGDIEDKVKLDDSKFRKISDLNNSLLKKIKDIEKKLEDQVNRSCRKTLIIKNVKEGDETWADSKQLVAKTLNEICHVQLDGEENIERAHRGKKRKDSSKPRDIHAAFYDWNDVNMVLEGYRKHGLSNKAQVYVEQRYGPDTTWRRNKAMMLRRELIEERKIKSAYVAFPAKLMVKKRDEDKYTLYKDFSNIEITEV